MTHEFSEVIRASHPIADDVIAGFSVQIDGTGKPVQRFFGMRLSATTNTWVSCAAWIRPIVLIR